MGFAWVTVGRWDSHEKPTLGSEWAQWVNPSKTRTGPGRARHLGFTVDFVPHPLKAFHRMLCLSRLEAGFTGDSTSIAHSIIQTFQSSRKIRYLV